MKDFEIVEDIKQKVSKYFKLSIGELTSEDRDQRFMYPRFITIALIFENTSLLPKEIMGAIGGKHRSSFYNAIKSWKGIRSTPEMKNAYKYLKLLCDPDKPELPKDHKKTFYNWHRVSYKWEIEGTPKPTSHYPGFELKKPLLEKNLDTYEAVKNQL